MRLITTAAMALALSTAIAFFPRAETVNPPQLSGTWSGQILALGQPAIITLTLKAQSGGPAGGILWGGKAQCRTTQNYAGMKDNGGTPPTLVLTINGSGGGFCDRFWNGAIELTPSGNGQLEAVFLSAKGETLLETKLSRDATPSP